MFDINTATKKELQAELTRQGVGFPAKANVATLKGLLEGHTEDDGDTVDPAPAPAPEPAATPTGTGLKIEKDRPEQNGIKRPSAGGRCRAVWDALDEYRELEGELPDAKFVRKLAEENGWNANNASIEFYQWRKFNGITGRQPKPAAAEPAKAS